MNCEMRMKIEELFKNIKSEEERDEISKEITRITSNINVSNRNRDKTEKFAEKIIKKENEKKQVFVKFLESKSVNGVNEKALKKFIEECESKNPNQMYIHLIRKDKEYGCVFERKNNITKLRQEAREYLNKL